jgi:hypothetical protein
MLRSNLSAGWGLADEEWHRQVSLFFMVRRTQQYLLFIWKTKAINLRPKALLL